MIETPSKFDLVYYRRHIALKAIGYATYAAYLDSRLWKAIRLRIFRRDKHKCRRCGQAAVVVHHRCYTEKTLLGGNDAGLISLCNGCHRHMEFNGEEKLKGQEVQKREGKWAVNPKAPKVKPAKLSRKERRERRFDDKRPMTTNQRRSLLALAAKHRVEIAPDDLESMTRGQWEERCYRLATEGERNGRQHEEPIDAEFRELARSF